MKTSNFNVKNIEDIVTKMSSYLKNNYTKGTFERDAHPKTLGLVKGEFTVYNNIPKELKHGVFSSKATYHTFIRFSNASHKIQSDIKKDIRGLSLKLIDVPEENRFNESQEKNTQDFLLMSHPTMPFGTLKKFRDAIVNTVESKWYQKLVWALTYFKLLKNIASAKKAHESITNINYWSTTPYKLGNNSIVKYKVTPKIHEHISFEKDTSNNKLINRLKKQLNNQEVAFDFCVQLYKNEKNTPLDDMGKIWDENLNPFIKIATLLIPKQEVNPNEELNKKITFSPANSLLAHEPIGEMNLGRIAIYKSLSEIRKKYNAVTAYFEPNMDNYSNL